MKDLDKMTFDEIKQYVKELEEFKQKMSSFSENDLRKLKILYVEKKIETSPFLKFSKLITIDWRRIDLFFLFLYSKSRRSKASSIR